MIALTIIILLMFACFLASLFLDQIFLYMIALILFMVAIGMGIVLFLSAA